MGAGNPPTIFWTWGGGPLKQYIDAGDVQSLAAHYASSFRPPSLGAVTFDSKLYGVPIEGTQPVYFFYNKDVFRKAGLSRFPSTWSSLLADVHTLKAKGYTPISLAEGDQWPGLMYLEYLTDRIGGPGAFDAIEQGKAGAWSSPAVIQALTDIQQLVKAGAFQSGYDSLKYSGAGPMYWSQRQSSHPADGRLGHLLGSGPEQELRHQRQPGPGPVPGGRGRQGQPV